MVTRESSYFELQVQFLIPDYGGYLDKGGIV